MFFLQSKRPQDIYHPLVKREQSNSTLLNPAIKQESDEEAFKSFETAIQQNPNDASAWNNLGSCYLNNIGVPAEKVANKDIEAIACYQRVLSIPNVGVLYAAVAAEAAKQLQFLMKKCSNQSTTSGFNQSSTPAPASTSTSTSTSFNASASSSSSGGAHWNFPSSSSGLSQQSQNAMEEEKLYWKELSAVMQNTINSLAAQLKLSRAYAKLQEKRVKQLEDLLSRNDPLKSTLQNNDVNHRLGASSASSSSSQSSSSTSPNKPTLKRILENSPEEEQNTKQTTKES